MHVFIDTNIFETDPFWTNGFAKSLLYSAKEQKLKLYISKIVYEELRSHTIANYEKSFKTIDTAIEDHNRYRTKKIERINNINIGNEFDIFYNKLVHEFNMMILNYDKISFSIVMDRILKREKPFNDGRKEVKDCAIWLTYADYAEENNLEYCYLLTNNTSDFYKKSPINSDPTEYSIHEDLKKDSNKFRCFPSLRDFFRLVLETQITSTQKFKAWLNEININSEFVFEYLHKYAGDKIENRIYRLADKLEVNKVFKEKYWFMTGYCQINKLEWLQCKNVNTDMLENSCIVSSNLRLQATIEGRAYNPSYNHVEDKYQHLGNKEVFVNTSASFVLSLEGKSNAVYIEDVKFEGL